jgi:hypothetical protein
MSLAKYYKLPKTVIGSLRAKLRGSKNISNGYTIPLDNDRNWWSYYLKFSKNNDRLYVTVFFA